MSKINIEYNYDNSLEKSFGKEFPLVIDKDGDEDCIELSIEEAKKAIVELTRLVRELEIKSINKLMDDIIKEFG